MSSEMTLLFASSSVFAPFLQISDDASCYWENVNVLDFGKYLADVTRRLKAKDGDKFPPGILRMHLELIAGVCLLIFILKIHSLSHTTRLPMRRSSPIPPLNTQPFSSSCPS